MFVIYKESCCWINTTEIVVVFGFTVIIKRNATGLLLRFCDIECCTWPWVLDVW